MFWPDEDNVRKHLQSSFHYKMLIVYSVFTFTLQFSQLKRSHLRSKLPKNIAYTMLLLIYTVRVCKYNGIVKMASSQMEYRRKETQVQMSNCEVFSKAMQWQSITWNHLQRCFGASGCAEFVRKHLKIEVSLLVWRQGWMQIRLSCHVM